MRSGSIFILCLAVLLSVSLFCVGCRRTKETEARTIGRATDVSMDQSADKSVSSARDGGSEPKLTEKPALEAPATSRTTSELPKTAAAKGEQTEGSILVIDSGDPKYLEGPRPDLPTDGKPVDIIYRPPHMFALNFAKRSENDETRGITFATMTITDERGTDFEIHLLLRDGAKPIVPFFRLTGSQMKIGQSWSKPCGDFTVRVEMLDIGKTPGFPRSTLDWIKVRVQAVK